jgi:dimethylglycine dehydrogenase
VLYHLAKAGWTDVMLIERSELTSGSSWHAAGGFHTLNGDPNVAKLQAYTSGCTRNSRNSPASPAACT